MYNLIAIVAIGSFLLGFSCLAPLFVYFAGVRFSIRKRDIYLVTPHLLDRIFFSRGLRGDFSPREVVEKELRRNYLILGVVTLFLSTLWITIFLSEIDARLYNG